MPKVGYLETRAGFGTRAVEETHMHAKPPKPNTEKPYTMKPPNILNPKTLHPQIPKSALVGGHLMI